MEEELFFARNPFTKRFIRTDTNPQNCKLILQNEEEKFFCTRHQTWESAVSVDHNLKIGEENVKFLCGETEKGIILKIKPSPEYNLDYIKLGQYLEGEDKINCDIFGFRIRLNNSNNSTFLVETNLFDRTKFDNSISEKKGIYSIPKINSQNCYSLKTGLAIYDKCNYKLSAIPETIKKYAIDMIWEKYKNELSLQRKTPLTVNAEKKETDQIEALVRFPCEPGLGKLYPVLSRLKIDIPYNDKNAYFTVCEKLGIKSWKNLRELFNENPEILITAANVFKCGFKDLNIINDILNDRLYSSHIWPDNYIYRENDSFPVYFHWALSNHSERTVWNTFCRNLKTYIPENGDLSHITDIQDAAWSFAYQKDTLNPEILDAIKKDGLSKYNHDILAKSLNTEQNITFKYSDKQKKLEDEIKGYKFLLPEDSDSLYIIGAELHNCVATYRYSVQNNNCTIVYVTKDDFYIMCIEVREKNVHQCRTNFNQDPKGEEKEIFDKWCKKHNLTFTINLF